jgi:molybdopterin/thiamine biosynthesis adenylyltransferase
MGQLRFTDEEMRRYSRQMIVREVGGLGQARLRRGQAQVSSELEALYLAGAGVGTLTVPSTAIAGAVRAVNPLVEVRIGGELAAVSAEQASAAALAKLKELLGL